MHDLDRIEHLLRSKPLKHQDFERFAQDSLSPLFPGLSPIPGGTDWGRDADISGTGGTVTPRVLVTSSRTLAGVRSNLNSGLNSMKKHGVAYDRVVLVNPAELSTTERNKLRESAGKKGATLDVADIFDLGWVSSRLRRDGFWRQKLLGLKSDPITVSRRAPEIAESPWAHLPLAGRADDVASLNAIDGDLILIGPPGVGKSRLAEELTGAIFVDTAADPSQVTDDLRWLTPDVVIVDDAGRRQELVDRLRSLRRSEPDLFSFRLVLIGWPDEVDALQLWLKDATVFQVGLLERPPIDETIREMGVTGRLARGEILDQAEGRLGWAISLADLLVRSDDPQGLLSGSGLYREASRFLMRSGATDLVLDALGIIGAVGELGEREVKALSKTTGQPPHDVARAIESAAHSGLIDVMNRYSWERSRQERFYGVQPPMLMNAVVAERFFSVSVAAISLPDLYDEWPDHRVAIARAAIEAALLGAPGARADADDLYQRCITDEEGTFEQRLALHRSYALLDEAAANTVLALIQATVRSIAGDRSEQSGQVLEPAVGLAHLIAARYTSAAAVAVLLDACLLDSRPTNPNPGHPLRKLADLVHDVHPDIPVPTANRLLVAEVLEGWIAEEGKGDDRWPVAAAVFGTLLSVRLTGAFGEPADGRTFQLIEAVLTPEQMDEVYDTIWPRLQGFLAPDREELAAAVIGAAAELLRIGGGYDRPFGQSHPDASIAKAAELGKFLMTDLAAAPLSRGSQLYLESNAANFDLDLGLSIDLPYEPFLREIERRPDDWQAAESQLIADIQAMARTWSAEAPEVVMARLLDLRAEIEAAHLVWPDRTWIAALALGEAVEKPAEWLRAAMDAGLYGLARPFMLACLAAGTLDPADLDRLLAEPENRLNLIAELLQSDVDWVVDRAIEAVDYGVFRVMSFLALRDELTIERWSALFDRLPADIAAIVAAGFADGRMHHHDPVIPRELADQWQEVIIAYRPVKAPGVDDHDCAELFRLMATKFPDALAQMVQDTLDEAGSSGAYRSISHSSWDELYRLPGQHRLDLWRHFADNPTISWMLREHLIGSDIDWLRHLVDSGEVPANKVLSYLRGLGPMPVLEDLAELLVPRGVAPADVAGLALSGSWTGDESDHYDSLVDRFTKWTESDSPSIKAVGEQGVAMFTARRDEAREREKRRRIRGQE